MQIKPSQFFFDNNIAITGLIWLASQSADQSCAFKDFLDDSDPEELKKITGVDVLENGITSFDDAEAVVCELGRRGVEGFLVKASTPIPTDFLKGGGYISSWGYTANRWFYTNSLDKRLLDDLWRWRETVFNNAKKAVAARKAKKKSKAD